MGWEYDDTQSIGSGTTEEFDKRRQQYEIDQRRPQPGLQEIEHLPRPEMGWQGHFDPNYRPQLPDIKDTNIPRLPC